jgi:carbonic anhydrase-like protein
MSLVSSHKVRVGTCQGCRPQPHARRPALDRRRLIGLLGIGAAWVVAGTSLPGRGALAAGGTEALLLNCIDYRLTAATSRYMADRQMEGKYDQFILAGASLGAKTDQFPAWSTTFWEHVQVAIDLHRIRRIIVMDHRDCGAYKEILGLDLAANPAEEFDVHAGQMRSLRADIGGRHPGLAVELLLMGLDGKAETVA